MTLESQKQVKDPVRNPQIVQAEAEDALSFLETLAPSLDKRIVSCIEEAVSNGPETVTRFTPNIRFKAHRVLAAIGDQLAHSVSEYSVSRLAGAIVGQIEDGDID